MLGRFHWHDKQKYLKYNHKWYEVEFNMNENVKFHALSMKLTPFALFL